MKKFISTLPPSKANKSPGFDNILNEVIKIGKDAIKGHLVNLFNRINTLLFGVLASLHLFAKRMVDPKLKITEVPLCFLRYTSYLHQSSTIDCTTTWFKNEF